MENKINLTKTNICSNIMMKDVDEKLKNSESFIYSKTRYKYSEKSGWLE